MIKCELCFREFKKMTLTHLSRSHELTMDEYRTRFPEAILVDETSRAAFAAKMTGRTGRKLSNEQRRHLSEKMTMKYASDPTYRDRVSAGTKAGMNEPEVRARFDAAIANRDISGERNPFFGKHHTNETKRMISENEERNEKIAAKRHKWWDERAGQTVEQLYGDDVGARLRQQKSERMTGEKNPAFGKVYEGSGLGKMGKYKGYFFRSTWEYSFYKHLEAQGYDLQTQVIHEPMAIPYAVNGKNKTYTPDFLIGPKKLLVEVKTQYELEWIERQALNNAKFAAAQVFCVEKNLTFKVMTENDFMVIPYKIALHDSDVAWFRGRSR